MLRREEWHDVLIRLIGYLPKTSSFITDNASCIVNAMIDKNGSSRLAAQGFVRAISGQLRRGDETIALRRGKHVLQQERVANVRQRSFHDGKAPRAILEKNAKPR